MYFSTNDVNAYTKTVRPIANPNESFIEQLRRYETILEQERTQRDNVKSDISSSILGPQFSGPQIPATAADMSGPQMPTDDITVDGQESNHRTNGRGIVGLSSPLTYNSDNTEECDEKQTPTDETSDVVVPQVKRSKHE